MLESILDSEYKALTNLLNRDNGLILLEKSKENVIDQFIAAIDRIILPTIALEVHFFVQIYNQSQTNKSHYYDLWINQNRANIIEILNNKYSGLYSSATGMVGNNWNSRWIGTS